MAEAYGYMELTVTITDYVNSMGQLKDIQIKVSVLSLAKFPK